MSIDHGDSGYTQKALRVMGFQSGEPVYEFTPDFTLDDVWHSLIASTHSTLKTVPVRAGDGAIRQIAVDAVERVFAQGDPKSPYVREDGYYEDADLKVLGMELTSPLRVSVEDFHVVLYLVRINGQMEAALLQRIPLRHSCHGTIEVIEAES